MSALKSLMLATQLAKRLRDELAAQLKRCKQSMFNAQGQLDQLCAYADETQEKWVVASSVGVTPEIMRHQNQFMARLQEAIGLQQSVIKNIDSEMLSVQEKYLGSELRLASLELMKKSQQSSLDALQRRRDQKQTDEFASMRKVTVFETV